jgi:hypothetical protein
MEDLWWTAIPIEPNTMRIPSLHHEATVRRGHPRNVVGAASWAEGGSD